MAAPHADLTLIILLLTIKPIRGVSDDECFCDEGCFNDDLNRVLCCTSICRDAEDRNTHEQCNEKCPCYKLLVSIKEKVKSNETEDSRGLSTVEQKNKELMGRIEILEERLKETRRELKESRALLKDMRKSRQFIAVVITPVCLFCSISCLFLVYRCTKDSVWCMQRKKNKAKYVDSTSKVSLTNSTLNHLLGNNQFIKPGGNSFCQSSDGKERCCESGLGISDSCTPSCSNSCSNSSCNGSIREKSNLDRTLGGKNRPSSAPTADSAAAPLVGSPAISAAISAAPPPQHRLDRPSSAPAAAAAAISALRPQLLEGRSKSRSSTPSPDHLGFPRRSEESDQSHRRRHAAPFQPLFQPLVNDVGAGNNNNNRASARYQMSSPGRNFPGEAGRKKTPFDSPILCPTDRDVKKAAVDSPVLCRPDHDGIHVIHAVSGDIPAHFSRLEDPNLTQIRRSEPEMRRFEINRPRLDSSEPEMRRLQIERARLDSSAFKLASLNIGQRK